MKIPRVVGDGRQERKTIAETGVWRWDSANAPLTPRMPGKVSQHALSTASAGECGNRMGVVLKFLGESKGR